MQELPIKRLLNLAQIDRDLMALELKKKRYTDQMQAAESSYTVCLEKIAQCEQIQKEARKSVDQCELEMKELDQKRSFLAAKLDQVHTGREYTALKHEVESIKQQEYTLESTLLAAWKRYEESQEECKKQKNVCVQVEEQSKQVVLQVQSEAQAIETEIESLRGAKAIVLTEIPVEWVERYGAMRHSVPDPIVPVAEGSCSACFYVLRPQELLDLQKRKLLHCKDCFRFLYMPERLEQ